MAGICPMAPTMSAPLVIAILLGYFAALSAVAEAPPEAKLILRGASQLRASPIPSMRRPAASLNIRDQLGSQRYCRKRTLDHIAAHGTEGSAFSAKRMTVRGGEAPANTAQVDTRNEEPATDVVDEKLYSRQLYVLGHDAMRRMQQCSILLCGLGGLGVEIAKDLALAGVKSLTLHDPNPVEITDLSSQFYCTEEDIGKNRANVTRDRIADLNQYVKIDVLEGEVGPEEIRNFSLVICSDQCFGECVLVNDACRELGINFIMAQTRGVFGNIFVDFGPEFLVSDTNGENPAQAMISAISQDTSGLVTTMDEQRHGFEDGDYVTFTEVQGMTELNGIAPVPIKVLGPYTFTICDTSKFRAYSGGGYARQVKQAKKVAFKSMRQSLVEPEFITSDFAKMDRERQLLVAFQAVDSFYVQVGSYPAPACKEDADIVVTLANQFNQELRTEEDDKLVNAQLVDKVDEALVRQLAHNARGELCPMTAVIGSIAAQEAMKACTGKFMPIKQWFMFDATEVLPEGPLPPEEFEAEDSRYDGQIAVLGKTVQRRLESLRYFLVGAGAIGCEALKNWALMGVGCGPGGAVYVTDMDTIERSNLNRQFLFRPSDIQQLKSVAAARKAKEMNPALNVEARASRVGPETEEEFDDEFFEGLHGVCNALDNVQARMYMDQRCVYFSKPLLDSGTLGTKGNVQVVIPHFTESYSSSRDPPEKAIPICTLKNFPNAIEHTIQWARDDFEGTFKQAPDDAAAYLESPAGFLDRLRAAPTSARATAEGVERNLASARPKNLDDCVAWARGRFQEMFVNSIQQLLFNFPLDMFDPADPTHVDFVAAAARLRAINFGIPVEGAAAAVLGEDGVRAVVESLKVPEFRPQQGVRIATTDADAEGGSGGGEGGGGGDGRSEEDRMLQEMVRKLPNPAEVRQALPAGRLTPIEFDKDDDAHMDYITAASNLRAANYNIPPADKHSTRLIAGKIIPAIATTTSLVTGLACLEMYKLIQNKKLEAFKNGFVNLALPFFGFSEPIPAPVNKYLHYNWTLWSRFDIDGTSMTLNKLIEHMKNEYQLEVNMVSCGVAMLYTSFGSKAKMADRLDMPIANLIREVGKVEIGPKQKYLMLEVSCTDAEGEDVETPTVRLRLR